MRFIRTKAVIAAAGLALSLAACGDAGEDSDRRRRRGRRRRRPSFDDGTRMKEFADAGTINVGVKYDQPGLGFNATGSTSRRLRRRHRQDPRRRPRHRPRRHLEGEVHRDDLRQPRALPPGGQGRPRPRVVLHHRRAPRRRGPGRPLHDHRPAAARPDDSDIAGPDDLKGKEVCSVTGSTSLDNAKAEGMKPRRLRHLQPVRRQGARRHRRGDDDRRHDPARLRRAERGRAQGRRRPVLRGAHRRRLLPGPPRDVPVDQRHPRARPTRTALGRGLRGQPRCRRAWRRPTSPSSTPARPDHSRPERPGPPSRRARAGPTQPRGERRGRGPRRASPTSSRPSATRSLLFLVAGRSRWSAAPSSSRSGSARSPCSARRPPPTSRSSATPRC